MNARALLAILLLLAALLPCLACRRMAEKSASGEKTMDFAEGNWLDIVAGDQSGILVATIGGVVATDGDPEVAQGRLKVEVVKNLTPDRWKGPREFESDFAQYRTPLMRIKTGQQGWNGIHVEQGGMILFASARRGAEGENGTPATVHAIAVAPLQSPQDDMIQGVEEALVIESTREAPQRVEKLRAGLSSKHSFLRSYAHYAMGRLRRIPRESAVHAEIAHLSDRTQPMQERVASLTNLELELWEDGNARDPHNREIVAELFRDLAGDESELQKRALSALSGLLSLDESEPDAGGADFRSEIIKGLTLPSKTRLLAALEELAHDPEVGDEARTMREFVARRL